MGKTPQDGRWVSEGILKCGKPQPAECVWESQGSLCAAAKQTHTSQRVLPSIRIPSHQSLSVCLGAQRTDTDPHITGSAARFIWKFVISVVLVYRTRVPCISLWGQE